MKLKLVVIDLQLSNRARRVAAAGIGVIPMLVAGVALGGPPFKAGDTLKATDLNAIDERIASLEQGGAVAASAQRTGSVPPNTAAWTTIPGMSVSIDLPQGSLVQAAANGVQRTVNLSASTSCQVWYRWVVDGVPKDANGRIQKSNGATSTHATWTTLDFNTLGAGPHTIEVQVHHEPGEGGCYVCAEFDGSQAGQDSCTLNVIGVPQ